MDEASYQQWSSVLAEMRESREKEYDEAATSRADSFSPQEFYDVATKSLDKILTKWFEFEQLSYELQPPADTAAYLDQAKGESDSVIDFEAEAVFRDKINVESRITWDPNKVAAEENTFRGFLDELRTRYHIKLKNMVSGSSSGGAQKKKAPSFEPAVSVRGSHSSSGNGLGLFFMFVVGLLLGGGPSLYFMENAGKADKKFQEERGKMMADQRAMADTMTLLRDSFEKLATGKMKNIAELENEIQEVKAANNQKRAAIERAHARDRERLLRKIPAGDRLDKAMSDLDQQRDEKLEALARRESEAVDPLVKQQKVLKDLMAQ